MESLTHRIKIPLILLGLVIFAGTLGYHLAGLTWMDALYQTVITVTTVGYSDQVPAPEVKPFTILIVAIGTLNVAILISLVTATLVETKLREIIGRRKVESRVRKLENHIILCGFGRFGRVVAEELGRRRTPFVVLDRDPVKAESARTHGCLVLEADATEEESLTRAGLHVCHGVLTTLGSDADNVYVTLTAKQLKRTIQVVAIALDERAASKLKAAGADEVVSPYRLGGTWMAQVLTSPVVADVMKMATGLNPLDFYLDEQKVAPASTLCGLPLRETTIRRDLGVIVVAVRQADGTLVTNPASDFRLAAGDVLVSFGGREQLEELRGIAAGSGASC